jgi:demethylmenaquinone methyltransferase/2-methoxy-6-polyprenyl-1,4-benzoquinol methylase
MTQSTLPSLEEKSAYVKSLFDQIAGGYDNVNDWMTGGLHRLWKDRMLRILGAAPGQDALDLATGTGDLAFRLHAIVTAGGAAGTVTGLDFSPGMLDVARTRSGGTGVTWLEGDMMALPFADASFDIGTVGFGLRNVTDVDVALRDVFRVMKPGGAFGSLETGRPRLALMRGVIAVHHKVVPLLGKVFVGDDKPYRYLNDSFDAFMDQDTLAERFRAAGFVDVQVADIQGGSLAIVTGRKPL